jgi:hypothetical protein
MSDETEKTEPAGLDPEEAVAIVAAVILHRSSVESEVVLLENGERDEGFWGRAGRAGPSSVLTHRPHRS